MLHSLDDLAQNSSPVLESISHGQYHLRFYWLYMVMVFYPFRDASREQVE